MAAIVNGRADGCIDPADRGLLYGDGLFETIAMRDGRARFLDWHLERLAEGGRRLALPLPEAALLKHEIERAWPQGRGVVKLILTRGVGERGYRPSPEPQVTRIVSGYAWPPDVEARNKGIRLGICRTRLGRNAALAGIKHLNRLEQVLARAECDDARMDEGLMLDDREHAISGTMSNAFFRLERGWITPLMTESGVSGVMRRAFRVWATGQGIAVEARDVPVAELSAASAMLVTNAVIGARPIRMFAGRALEIDRVAGRFNAWLETQ
ncbi:MAG TPA: aminodeoxychorismate lyase [Steroidobacteraceae bacterium]|nr:aminodeoxychorismate lyase [Steroidobacteraceae bacterium]